MAKRCVSTAPSRPQRMQPSGVFRLSGLKYEAEDADDHGKADKENDTGGAGEELEHGELLYGRVYLYRLTFPCRVQGFEPSQHPHLG